MKSDRAEVAGRRGCAGVTGRSWGHWGGGDKMGMRQWGQAGGGGSEDDVSLTRVGANGLRWWGEE